MTTISNITLCHPRRSSGQDSNTAVLAKSFLPAILPANHVQIKVDRFGYSANNVTYQALGEVPHFRYFDFHEAPIVLHPEAAVFPSTHGVTPVWGFGTVVASTHPGIPVGERVYGYFAPTRYLVLSVPLPDVHRHAFYVSRPYLPEDRRPYNQITRCSADPLYDPSPEVEDLTMLYRPLFWTSFWCEDWINSSQYRGGATRILISSASAKTAFCLASLIRKRAAATSGSNGSLRQVVGLTSKRNVEFTKRLGLYNHVFEYDGFENATVMSTPGEKWIYIDVAGNESLNVRIFNHFSATKSDLLGSIALGLTNLSPTSESSAAPNWSTNDFSSERAPTTLETFFMPEWLAIRRNQLSVQDITQLQKHAWSGLMQDCGTWGITIHRVSGPENVKRAYEEVVKSGIPPNQGFVWNMWDEEVVNARL